MSNAIEIRGLTKEYDDFKLDNIDITLPKGYIMGFIGENGAGKTTTIKAMLDLINIDGGQISILGETFDANRRQSSALREHVGVVLDHAGLPDSASAEDAERIMRSCYSTWDSTAFRGYMEKFGLPAKKKVKDYSRGMKMKLCIAIALSHGCKLLILDEATSGLDPVVRDEILDIFREFIQDEEHSVFISSHILSDLEKICDYITFIHEGRIIFSESKDELLEKYGILKCSEDELEAIESSAVIAYKKNEFGIEALVEREKVNPSFIIDDAGIEDIMIYFTREGRR